MIFQYLLSHFKTFGSFGGFFFFSLSYFCVLEFRQFSSGWIWKRAIQTETHTLVLFLKSLDWKNNFICTRIPLHSVAMETRRVDYGSVYLSVCSYVFLHVYVVWSLWIVKQSVYPYFDCFPCFPLCASSVCLFSYLHLSVYHHVCLIFHLI